MDGFTHTDATNLISSETAYNEKILCCQFVSSKIYTSVPRTNSICELALMVIERVESYFPIAKRNSANPFSLTHLESQFSGTPHENKNDNCHEKIHFQNIANSIPCQKKMMFLFNQIIIYQQLMFAILFLLTETTSTKIIYLKA